MFKTFKKKLLMIFSLLAARHSIKAFEYKVEGKQLSCKINYYLAKLYLAFCLKLETKKIRVDEEIIKC